MVALPPQEARAFRNAFLAAGALLVLSSGAGWQQARSQPAACAAGGEQPQALERILARLGSGPLLGTGSRLLALVARALAGCD